MTKSTDTQSARPIQRQKVHWLWASVPVALIMEVCLTGLARFTWRGFNTCHYLSTAAELRISVITTIPLLFGVFSVTFLAVVLPPWITGSKQRSQQSPGWWRWRQHRSGLFSRFPGTTLLR